MGEPRTIAGCSVLKEATAREYSRHKVVICELPDAKEGENRAGGDVPFCECVRGEHVIFP